MNPRYVLLLRIATRLVTHPHHHLHHGLHLLQLFDFIYIYIYIYIYKIAKKEGSCKPLKTNLKPVTEW